jgi:hypothetical protein
MYWNQIKNFSDEEGREVMVFNTLFQSSKLEFRIYWLENFKIRIFI